MPGSLTSMLPQILGGLAGALGSGGGGDQTTTTTQDPWGPQGDILRQIFEQMGGLLGEGGQITPGMGGVTAEGLSAQEAAARGFGDFLAPYQQAQQFALGDVLSPESNPYLQAYMDMVQGTMTRNLTENVLPQLAGGAVGAGGFGGSRQGIAEGLAAGRTAERAGEAMGGIASRGYGQGLQLLNAALGRAPQMAALQFLPGAQLREAGAAREGYEERLALDPYRRLGLAKDIVSGSYGGTTTQTTPGAQGSPVMGGIGGVIAGGQLSNQFNWSDIFGGGGGTPPWTPGSTVTPGTGPLLNF